MKIKLSLIKELVRECINESITKSKLKEEFSPSHPQVASIELVKAALQRVQFDQPGAVKLLHQKSSEFPGEKGKAFQRASEYLKGMTTKDVQSLFAGVREESEPEPYDQATDTFQPSPRDRTEPSKSSQPKPKKSSGQQPYSYPTLSNALDSVEEYIAKNRIQLDPNEHQTDDADPTGIREPYRYGGINYQQKKDANYKLLSYKGKPTRKYLHVSIYRLESGNYEVVTYVL